MTRKSLSLAAAALTLGFSGAAARAATLQAAYVFNGNLNAQESGVAALIAVDPLGESGFITDTVFGSSRTVYAFTGNASPASSQAGLTFNDSSNLITPDSYSIEMVFDLAAISGYRRLVDTQDRVSDDGLYTNNGDIQLYPDPSGATEIVPNTYADLIFTDNGTTVVAYLNGVQQFSVADAQLNLNNANNPGQLLNLFLDNNQGGTQNEYSSGNIALFEAFDGVLSQSDVTTLSANPFGNVQASSSTPEPASYAMLLGGALSIAATRLRRRRE